MRSGNRAGLLAVFVLALATLVGALATPAATSANPANPTSPTSPSAPGTSTPAAIDQPAATHEVSEPVSVDGRGVDLSTLAVAPGYRLDVDSVGYDLPTAIAMIPEPFEGAGAPIYFVAELQGSIKVVTRDRQVHDFASVPTWGRQGHDLGGNSQQGLAGLCLAPRHGYLFATFTEPDDGGVMRNRIVRFSATPVGYGLSASAVTQLASEVSAFQSAPAHQIGNCVVVDEQLFVGVGDGGNPKVAADPAVLLGKVLCLTLEGEPCAGAPYGESGNEALVYAKGFRNPFGLVWQAGSLHAVENGIDLDRFLPVRPGRDHLWNGTDEALSSVAEIVFPNPFAPVQLDHVPAAAPYMDPGWSGGFVASGYGSKHVPAGVAAFGGAPREGALADPPRYLIEYQGPVGSQHFGGVAAGPDGLYVTPMLPLDGAPGAVLRLSYDPSDPHQPQVAKATGLFRSPELDTLNDLGCTGCHAVAGTGGGIGPNLDRFGLEWRITEYLNSAAYETALAALPTDGGRRDAARRAVLAAEDDERTWVWVRELLLDPRFDDPERQMPDLSLSVDAAEAARAELFAAVGLGRKSATVESVLVRLRNNLRPLLAGALAGALLVLAVIAAYEHLLSRRRLAVADRLTAAANTTSAGDTRQTPVNRGTGRSLPTSSGEYR